MNYEDLVGYSVEKNCILFEKACYAFIFLEYKGKLVGIQKNISFTRLGNIVC